MSTFEKFQREWNQYVKEKSLSKVTLQGSVPEKAEIMNEQYYSLVCLKPGSLADALNNMQKLSDAQRNSIVKRAKEAEEDLQEELENYEDM